GAALQPATYELAAETGIGVMALSVAAPSYLAPHIQKYKERVRHAKPVGKFINDQWLSSTMALCDWDNKGARELAAKSLRTFFGPDRPYLKDQTHLYEQLVASWGGVPEHLMATETVPHDKVMTSIELFGKHVIPELKKRSEATPRSA